MADAKKLCDDGKGSHLLCSLGTWTEFSCELVKATF